MVLCDQYVLVSEGEVGKCVINVLFAGLQKGEIRGREKKNERRGERAEGDERRAGGGVGGSLRKK